MHSNNSNRSRAASARGFVALCAVLAMGLGLSAPPAAAAPFAYVTNSGDNTVSVIDTATNTVVATIGLPAGSAPHGVAVTPDGKHVYVSGNRGVQVIDTATNTVVATVLGLGPSFGAIAVTPDGAHAYVLESFNAGDNRLVVIDTATNTVVTDILVFQEGGAADVAVTPNGKHAYVTASSFFGAGGIVEVIDTATFSVVKTIQVGSFPGASPSPLMEHTPMSRTQAPTPHSAPARSR